MMLTVKKSLTQLAKNKHCNTKQSSKKQVSTCHSFDEIVEKIPASEIALKLINAPDNAYLIQSKVGNPGTYSKFYIARTIKNQKNENIPNYVGIKKLNYQSNSRLASEPEKIE